MVAALNKCLIDLRIECTIIGQTPQTPPPSLKPSANVGHIQLSAQPSIHQDSASLLLISAQASIQSLYTSIGSLRCVIWFVYFCPQTVHCTRPFWVRWSIFAITALSWLQNGQVKRVSIFGAIFFGGGLLDFRLPCRDVTRKWAALGWLWRSYGRKRRKNEKVVDVRCGQRRELRSACTISRAPSADRIRQLSDKSLDAGSESWSPLWHCVRVTKERGYDPGDLETDCWHTKSLDRVRQLYIWKNERMKVALIYF